MNREPLSKYSWFCKRYRNVPEELKAFHNSRIKLLDLESIRSLKTLFLFLKKLSIVLVVGFIHNIISTLRREL